MGEGLEEQKQAGIQDELPPSSLSSLPHPPTVCRPLLGLGSTVHTGIPSLHLGRAASVRSPLSER